MTSPSRRHTGPSTSTRASNRWPYCVVWTPLPVITWFIPLIGHTGIGDSKGIIYDFAGDYTISTDNLSFGEPTKFYACDDYVIANRAEIWDNAIRETNDRYSRMRHSLFFNNCHKYIAHVYNLIKLDNRTDWTQFDVWYHITFKSSYVDIGGLARQWGPFCMIIIISTLVLLFAFK